MRDFFNLITANWVGLVIGIVVAALVCLVLGFTLFRNNKIAGAIISILLIIAFGCAGIFIQKEFFGKNDTSQMPTPGEQGELLNKNIINGWLNTNGGFTFEQIKKAQEDDECPTYDDQLLKMKVTDFGDYVTFSFQDGKVYRNALFVRTNDGLIYDGTLNMTGDFNTYMAFIWKAVDLNSWWWDYTLTYREPYYVKKRAGSVREYWYDDMVSVSSMTPSYMQYDHWCEINECRPTALKKGVELSARNVTDYFIKFGNIELVGEKDKASSAINTFYNYLFEEVKNLSSLRMDPKTKIVDSMDMLCLPIPKNLQSEYPVSKEFKELYPDIDYYGVYKCDIALELTYVRDEFDIDKNTKVDNYVEENKDKDITKVEKINQHNNIANLEISFNNTNNSNISNVDFNVNPVTIEFTSGSLKKTVNIDNIDKLKSKINVILDKGVTWTYEITSNKLIFSEFRGTFNLTNEKSKTTFDYYYLDNYVVIGVFLNPIGSIDKTKINLIDNPVKIILSNEKHTYSFLFNSNDMIDSSIPSAIELGDYDYTILSEQLIFASVSGKLTITSRDTVRGFNYTLSLQKDDLDFKVSVTAGKFATDYFNLYSDVQNVDIIRNHLTGDKNFNVSILFYDSQDKMVLSFNHDHSSTGACRDNWSKSDLLINGEKYVVQLRFTDSADTSKTYMSDIVTIEKYDNTLSYTFTYTVSVVQ